MIVFDAGVRDEIAREGENAYPNECCGFLLGNNETGADGGRFGARIVAVRNTRDEAEAFHRFEITPQDFLRAEREAVERGEDVIGIYHSHPDHPAVPSAYDLEYALPYYSYVIVSVNGRKAADIRSWRLEDGRSGFLEEKISEEGELKEG
jgi:proteasome lid subunit RPN8/RPN11